MVLEPGRPFTFRMHMGERSGHGLVPSASWDPRALVGLVGVPMHYLPPHAPGSLHSGGVWVPDAQALCVRGSLSSLPFSSSSNTPVYERRWSES